MIPTLLKNDEPKNIGAVIVGLDDEFNVAKITRAINYLQNPNCLFVGTNIDVSYPLSPPYPIIPLDGAFIATIETATGRKATILGKPDKHYYELIASEQEIIPEKTLFIGDQLNTDIKFGNSSGFQTLLVETGTHNRKHVDSFMKSGKEEDQIFIPNVIIPKLTDLLPILEKMVK